MSSNVDFLDGEWHRLHPATPLLKGGFAFVAIAGYILSQQRDTILATFFGTPNEEDPLDLIYRNGFALTASLIVLGVILLIVAAFYVAWRMHTFRITSEVVEVRSGVVFRTNRKARLDRIQGINVGRPLFARLFGAARLEISVAGQDGNVQLAYLGSLAADQLRSEVLRLASGTHVPAAPAAAVSGAAATGAAPTGTVIEQRVAELLAPEFDRTTAGASVVSMHLGRVIGSLVLSNTTVWLVIIVAAIVSSTAATGIPFFAFGILPMLIGVATFYWSRFVRSLRYTISSSPDGIRIGWGLLSTTNETLPPGRIHAVELSQPLLWRIAGWWEVRVTLASKSSVGGASGQPNTTILPVGSAADVFRVLELVYPQLSDERLGAILAAGIGKRTDDDGYTTSPRRGALLRWFSWRRNGFALGDGLVLLRTGAVWRRLAIVPLVRMQSVAIERGPLRRRLRLSTVRIHLVPGPVTAAVGAIDADTATSFFDLIAAQAVALGHADASQRWRSHETS